MSILATLTKLSLRNLRANTVRTVLTLLGIIISVVAIMLIVILGENVKGFVLGQVESFGSDYVQVEVKVPEADVFSRDNVGGRVGTKITTLTLEDAEAIEQLPNVKAVNPGIIAQERTSYKNETKTTPIFGTGAEQIDVDAQLEIADGAFFSDADERRTARVIVLGSQIAVDLFGSRSSVGESVKIRGKNYRVTGVMKERGSFGPLSFDDFVYIPITTVQKTILGVDHIDWYTAQVFDTTQLDRTARDITQIMRSRHGTKDERSDDFAVATPDQLIGQIGDIFGVINILLIALASISLLVGGVGIMNVMLVAVEERISEIGLRKSVGARKSDIVRQFLIEALVIALFGGVIGIILGFGLTFLGFFGAAKAGFALDNVVPLTAPLLAVGFSIAAGLLFGLYPAKKAAKTPPIEALRGT